MEISERRLDYIDITKAVGMYAIIWGHIMLQGWSNLLVYSFHIPLFFFLSGMVFNGGKYTSLWQFVRRRVKTLIFPYLIFSVITWILWVCTKLLSHEHVNFLKPLFETFVAQGSVGYVVHNLPLWFVPCLFVVEIIYYFLNKLPELLILICCVFCAFVGNYMIRGGNLDFYSQLPWSIEGAMNVLIFYSLGNILIKLYNHNDLLSMVSYHKNICTALIVLLTLVLLYSSIRNGAVSVGSNELGNNTLFFYINAFIGIFTTITFCLLLSLINAKCKTGKKILLYLKWFGRNSFYVMATHFPLKEAFIRLFANIMRTNRDVITSDMKYSLLVFLITLIVDSIIVLFICKMKVRDIYRLALKKNGK